MAARMTPIAKLRRAYRAWRAPDPECEHGNHPRVCPECPPIRSYKEFRRRYFPNEVERERRERLSPEERAREDGEELARCALALLKQLGEHKDCRQEQIGSCMYCVDHDVRLYQGRATDGGEDG